MKNISAGLLMYRKPGHGLEIFLAHPGGPFFAKKDEGYWTIPKGLLNEGEELLQGAIREFSEETGMIPTGPFFSLGEVRQKGGKAVHAWAFETKDKKELVIQSNTFKMEWPPKSGKMAEFPEIDRAAFFGLEEALEKINEAQKTFIYTLAEVLHIPIG